MKRYSIKNIVSGLVRSLRYKSVFRLVEIHMWFSNTLNGLMRKLTGVILVEGLVQTSKL